MNCPRFELLDHTADIQLRAHGRDLRELFSNAAYGMLSAIADLSKVDAVSQRTVKVSANDLEGLLVSWLSELLFLFETQHLLFSRFDIKEITERSMAAEVFGEPLDPSKHETYNEIKAVTYHQLRITKENGHWTCEVILDI